MPYKVYRENGIINVEFPAGGKITLGNEDVVDVLIDPNDSDNILIQTSTGFISSPEDFSEFTNKSGGALGSTAALTVAALENILTSGADFGASVILDVTPNKTETTQLVHDGDVDNGGAVILDSNSALIGFQSGTFVKTTENIVQGRPYGRVQIKVDNGEGTGTAVDAIDILQGNVVQYPTITVSGEAVFAEDVEFQDAVILTSPNGTKYRLGVDNSGNLSTQAV